MPKLYLANTTIVPVSTKSGSGVWRVTSLTTAQARAAAQCAAHYNEMVSAVGHESTAAVMADLLEVDIEVNRLTIVPQVGDRILAFKLEQSLPEGVVLPADELDALDFGWFWLEYLR